MFKLLFQELSKDKEKVSAFLEYLIAEGKLTMEEVTPIVQMCEETKNQRRVIDTIG